MKDQKTVYFEEKIETFYLAMTNCINEELTNGWNIKGMAPPLNIARENGDFYCTSFVVFERSM